MTLLMIKTRTKSTTPKERNMNTRSLLPLVGRLLAPIAALACCTNANVWAQGAASYPSKPVNVVIPYAAGGPADVETRLYTGKLSPMLGQPFIIDYKPGAGTALGSGYVAKAAPDGYNLLVVTGSLTVFPALFKDLD